MTETSSIFIFTNFLDTLCSY